MTSGHENGTSEATWARVPPPEGSRALKEMKNDTRIRIVSGVVADCMSSWRDTSAAVAAYIDAYRA